ncbi:MAG: DUF3473 domain-containing protein [Phycisphaerae bacterium]|nr:DUF3473 domain-containing protein [Phycisphaerae bacterium]
MDVINAFTIDVEGWFNMLDIPGGPGREDWQRLEDRDTAQTLRMLDLVERYGARATCFMLGWTVDHRPGLLRDIARRGHEIASHGYGHDLLYEMTPQQFRDDLQRSKEVIHRECGTLPRGYRVPGFSLTESTPWAFQVLADAGFDYDSSLFPSTRGHGGMPSALRLPHYVDLPDGKRIREFPISVTHVFGRRIAYAGGGYLRFFPYRLVRRWLRRANEAGEPVILYIHPHDADVGRPRLRMPLKRRFKCYYNLHTTMGKLERLLQDFRWGTAYDVLNRALPAAAPPANATGRD